MILMMAPESRKRRDLNIVFKPSIKLRAMQTHGSEHGFLSVHAAVSPVLTVVSSQALAVCDDTSLLEPDKVLHPLDPTTEPRPIGRLV